MFERPRVEEERRSLGREARGHLVHDPHGRADELVFGAPAGLRERDVVEREAERVAQRAEHGDLERGARGETRAERDIGGDGRVEAADRGAALREDARDALDVVDPASARVFLAERVLLHAVRLAIGREESDAVSRPPRERDATAPRDRRGQDEAAAVVGVLTDEVHAAGRLRLDIRRAPEALREGVGAHASMRGARVRAHIIGGSFHRRIHAGRRNANGLSCFAPLPARRELMGRLAAAPGTVLEGLRQWARSFHDECEAGGKSGAGCPGAGQATG